MIDVSSKEGNKLYHSIRVQKGIELIFRLFPD